MIYSLMPQMSPMNWLLLLLFMIMYMYILISVTFFFFPNYLKSFPPLQNMKIKIKFLN